MIVLSIVWVLSSLAYCITVTHVLNPESGQTEYAEGRLVFWESPYMRPYKSKDSNTGVSYYEPGKDHIIIRFRVGGTYLYDHKKPGKKAVEKMKLLAEKGKGLSTYINKYVRENYAAKLE